MGWSFRKSKSFGPFRFNFSKSGISTSFGIKGARISINSRGTFVNLGANGIYYRQKIGGVNGFVNNNDHLTPLPSPSLPSSKDQLHTITTEDVENITDVDSQEFIKELESKANKISYLQIFGVWPSVFIMIYLLSFSMTTIEVNKEYKSIFTIDKQSVHVRSGASKDHPSIQKAKQSDQYDIAAIDSSGWVKIFLSTNHDHEGFVRADMGKVSNELTKEVEITRIERQPILKIGLLVALLLLIGWCIFMGNQDKKRKTLQIQYTLDSELETLHQKFITLFKEFSSSRKIWQKLHAYSVSDKKYHAGASELISRTTIGGIYNHKLPSQFLKTNISIPCIVLKNTELYFFPERLILKRGNKFGAAFYKNITILSENVRFVEEDALPGDAEIVDYTWKYPNKSGGPDGRFSDNRQLPICLYTDYVFESDTGVREVITTSKTGGMDHFCEFIKVIGNFQRNLN